MKSHFMTLNIPIELKNGGRVQVEITIDLWTISERDRTFVLSIIDACKDYEARKDLKESPPR